MKCKFEHDEDCCNSGSPQYMCKCKPDVCHSAVPMTNGDRIRAMSNKELAEWICSHMTAECCDQRCPARDICNLGDNGLVKWIEQPAEEVSGE